MRRILLFASCLSPLPLCCGTALAQQAIPETIITATRAPSTPDRVPAGITVIDRQMIEERGYVTLAEALAGVLGMRLVQTGGIGQQASGFIRGTNSRHVQVLLDGATINDSSDPNGSFNFGNELLGDIERIEVFRGPASSLYGSGAIGGAINLVTRRAPANREAQPFGELSGGSNRTGSAVLGIAGTVREVDYLAVGQSLSTQGSNATAPRFWDNQGERDGFRGSAFTARIGAQASPDTRLEAFLRYRENTFGLDNVPQDDPNYTANDRRWFGQFRAETRPVEWWTTGLRLAVGQDRRRYVNQPDSGSRATADDLFQGERVTLDWGNQVRLPGAEGISDAILSFGATQSNERVNQASGSRFFRSFTDAAADTTAVSLGLQFRLFERLDISAGLRNDSSPDYESATTWRLGAVLGLPEIYARLYASAGTGFLAPSLFQRFGQIEGFFSGNPKLSPERSTSWEVGFDTTLPAFGTRDFVTLSAVYFDTRITDLINFNSAFDSLENIDSARIKGAEFALTLRPAAWLQASLAWTLTSARDGATDQQLARRPETVVSFNARIAPLDKLVIVPEVLFTGRSPEGAFASYQNDGTANTTRQYNPSGTIVNLVVTYDVTPQAAVFVQGRNLGNSRWEPANGFVTPGRTAIAGVRATF